MQLREMVVSRDDQLLRIYIGDPQLDPELALAAWLHRRGTMDLQRERLPRQDQRSRRAFAVITRSACQARFRIRPRAMAVRDDSLAMSHAERLFRLYPDLIETHFPRPRRPCRPQAPAGGWKTQEAPEKEWPAGFSEWSVQKRLTYLIDSLDQIMYGEKKAQEPGRGFRFRPGIVDRQRSPLRRSCRTWRRCRSRTPGCHRERQSPDAPQGMACRWWSMLLVLPRNRTKITDPVHEVARSHSEDPGG